MSSLGSIESGNSKSDYEPDEYNLYLGFMVPIGGILALCIICLIVISWQLVFPECSKIYCPKLLLNSRLRAEIRAEADERNRPQEELQARRGTSITVVRRYSDFPPSYEALSENPPTYDSVVIIEEESNPSDRRNSGIRTYVYDPMRRISIEVHDEDTIRVVESLLSRRRSSTWSDQSQDPPGYHNVVKLPHKYPPPSQAHSDSEV